MNPYDIRTYGTLFHPTPNYIVGIKKFQKLLFHKRLSELSAQSQAPLPGTVVHFRGMRGKFQPFLDDHEFVRSELLAITREEHLSGFRARDPAPIGIHVRCGHFIQRPDYGQMINNPNSRLPLSWYVSALEEIRKSYGKSVRAYVFSDGTEEELAALLSMENVTRVEYGSSIAETRMPRQPHLVHPTANRMFSVARYRFLSFGCPHSPTI